MLPHLPSDLSTEGVLNRARDGSTTLFVTGSSELGAMSNRAAITVNAVAQQISIGANKTVIEIQNLGDDEIYIGGSTVSSTTGVALYTAQTKVFQRVKSTFSFYVVCAAGKTANVRVVEYA